MRFDRFLTTALAGLIAAAVTIQAAPTAAVDPNKVDPKVDAQGKKPTKPAPKKAKAKVKAPAKGKAVAKASPAASRPAPAPHIPSDQVELPLAPTAATVSEGCADARSLSSVASRIGIEETSLTASLVAQNLDISAGGPCVPFVVFAGGENGAATVVFQRMKGESPAVLRKTPDGITSGSDLPANPEWATQILPSRTLEAPIEDFSDPQSPIMMVLPASLRWELETLADQMMGTSGESDTDVKGRTSGRLALVEIGRREGAQADYLKSIEIVDSSTGERVDGAWWVERKDGPGALIGMKGDSYERLLWRSPVQYLRKSRGVGEVVRLVTAKVKGAKKLPNGKAPVRTVQIHEFHGGEDLSAPMGTAVHAVGNATVVFAGRRGTFGNLIILDHGLGYQTYYAHLSAIDSWVRAGATVARGETIGRVGSTGRSTGPHLHFETRIGGKYADPFDDSRALEFWFLTEPEQESLAMQILASAPKPTENASSVPVVAMNSGQ